MPLFATYRNSRLLAPGFMSNWVNWHRSIGEHFSGRPWAHGMFWIPAFSNMPTFLTWLMCFYWGQRQYMVREWDNDEYERTLIKRWGPTLEDVRKNLSPEDQARARGYAYYEKMHGVFLPAKMKFHPAGSDIPHGH